MDIKCFGEVQLILNATDGYIKKLSRLNWLLSPYHGPAAKKDPPADMEGVYVQKEEAANELQAQFRELYASLSFAEQEASRHGGNQARAASGHDKVRLPEVKHHVAGAADSEQRGLNEAHRVREQIIETINRTNRALEEASALAWPRGKPSRYPQAIASALPKPSSGAPTHDVTRDPVLGPLIGSGPMPGATIGGMGSQP